MRTSLWWRLTNTSVPPERTTAAADIGRGLCHRSTAAPPGRSYRANNVPASLPVSGGQSGSTSALPMPCARNPAVPGTPAALGRMVIRVQAAAAFCSPDEAALARLRKAAVSPPTTRVTTAATANEQIDADILTAGVKPIAWAMCVHADTHQEM